MGCGEATVMPIWSGETQESALAAIDKTLAPALTGSDARDLSSAAAVMDGVLTGNPFTKAAVEMALHDVVASSLGVSVWQLMGGRRREPAIPLKISIGAFSPAEAAGVAELAAAAGFRACKVKVGLNVREDLERVAAVRSALGPDFPVGVDANGGWSEEEAVAALPGLERLNMNMLEQPLRRGDFRGCARLRNRTGIPLMLDESIFTSEDALEAIRCEACDLISIYPGKNAGLRRSLEIAQLAASAGLDCVIGSNLEWDIATAAMLHLAVSIPNLSKRIHHDIIGPFYHAEPVSDPPVRIEQGLAYLPDGPGLGLEVPSYEHR